MISVFDYGAGNLRSVQNTLGAIGAQYELIRDAAGIRRAEKLILPGVGHFGQNGGAIRKRRVGSPGPAADQRARVLASARWAVRTAVCP